MDEEQEMPMGVWYELLDFSDRDYGSDWGYVLYLDRKEIARRSGFSKIKQAGDAARKAKRLASTKSNK